MLNLSNRQSPSPRRKLVNTAAVTLALAGGGVAGAVVGAPLISSAQDDDTTTTTDDPTTTEETTPPEDTTPTEETTPPEDTTSENGSTGDETRECGPGRWIDGPHLVFGGGVGLDTAAEALGMERDALVDEMQDGKTLAEVAEEQGVPTDELVTALVAEAEEKIDDAVADGDLDAEDATEIKENLTERITDAVNGELPDIGGVPHWRGPHVFGAGANLDTAAEALGMERDALVDELQDGKTLAEVAEEQGVSTDELVTALVADAEEKIDEAVADGDLDADEAAEIKQDLAGGITDFVNGELPEIGKLPHLDGPGMFRDRMGPWHDEDEQGDTQDEQSDESDESDADSGG